MFLRPLFRPRFLSSLAVVSVFSFGAGLHAQNIIARANNFDSTVMVDNPWGGVENGQIRVPGVSQLAVDESGKIVETPFGPSIAFGDLNGDGLTDMVLADSRGYFWYFQNHGTKTQPKFTTAEIIPIWVGEKTDPDTETGRDRYYIVNPLTEDDTVPRIQLVDLNHTGVLSLVVGNFLGQLYYFPNTGNPKQPVFKMPGNISDYRIDTYSQGHLWLNSMAPFLYDWSGTGRLDLITGEATYASNSIYYLLNKGSNSAPTFNENNTKKIIRGEGRECLTPVVADWNNDGKPDVICGERQGYIDVFLNTGTGPDGYPTFDQGQHVKFGTADKLGGMTTVAVADLVGNKMPNLYLSNSDCRLLYAENKGTPGNPSFGTPVPLAGVNPLPKVHPKPPIWVQERAQGIAYTLLTTENAQSDPTFTPPAPGINSVLKCYTVPHTQTVFPQDYAPEDLTHAISWGGVNEFQFVVKSGDRYHISFWVKTDGEVSDMHVAMVGATFLSEVTGVIGLLGCWNQVAFNASSDWTQVQESIGIPSQTGNPKEIGHCKLVIGYVGNGTVELGGFSMTHE